MWRDRPILAAIAWVLVGFLLGGLAFALIMRSQPRSSVMNDAELDRAAGAGVVAR